MLKRLLPFFLSTALLSAQDLTTLANVIALIKTPPTTFLTITDTAGDGASCVFTKLAGAKINYGVNCSAVSNPTVGSGGSFKGGQSSDSLVVVFHNVLIVTQANSTAATIPAAAPWPAIPPNSIAYLAGVGGGSNPSIGVVTWP